MSTYAGKDDCTDIILDLISEHESFGNYNAVIGDIRADDDLSQYTLNGIYDLMAKLLSEGQPSSAIGRYQIIRKTLQGLVASKNLPPDTLFTQKVQDSLAVSLLVLRGYMDWWDGKMTDEEFAHGLSCEWASLPDPDMDGKSHYDGVGPNHAGTTLKHVTDGLRRARMAQKRQPATPVAQDPSGASQGTAGAPTGLLYWVKGLFS